MSNVRQCMCCDNKYHYCPSCGSDRLKPTWYATFCSETCKDLWYTLSRYSMGFITKEEAGNVIKALDINDFGTYRQRVQKSVSEIMYMGPEKKPRRIKKSEPIVEVVIEQEIAESVKTELTEPTVVPVEIDAHYEVVIKKEKE